MEKQTIIVEVSINIIQIVGVVEDRYSVEYMGCRFIILLFNEQFVDIKEKGEAIKLFQLPPETATH
ncbi:hypothetical protein QFZ77_003100 [Paenibacillus sp. V4I3]|uniref:hypothetical protein n=1 Tax=Paenibacillus sp. V4I3 TaxID=3042305 RepID=UPI002783F22A|nr:hypothetical protein [Paenibacillus sp. V4I3]MDQ0874441.1 hypothetical protein [Paenibacillus sp. V4I3]